MLLAAIALALATGGCTQGVRWDALTYSDGLERAAARPAPVFVYFREWYLRECKDFEDNVLMRPEVLAETRTLTNVVLSFDHDDKLAAGWQLHAAPCYAIVTPGGELLASRQAPITVDDLLADVRAARATLDGRATATAPAGQ